MSDCREIDAEAIRAAGPAFQIAAVLADMSNTALETHGPSSDEWRRARAAFGAELGYWRELGEAMGNRVAANVVSHMGPAGPDTDSPEGDAYWDEVAAAAEAGVPESFGRQR